MRYKLKYKVWVEGHQLPIGASSEKDIKEIKEAFSGKVVRIEEVNEGGLNNENHFF